jgi:hypothetical protein
MLSFNGAFSVDIPLLELANAAAITADRCEAI